MAEPSDSEASTREDSDDSALPQLLQQAAALSLQVDAQLAILGSLAQPDLIAPSIALSAENTDDLPSLIARLRDKISHETSEMSSAVNGLGVTVPEGADMEGMLAVLAALPGVSAVTAGPLSVAPTTVASADDLPAMLKQLLNQQAAAQLDQDQAFSALGIDPAAPEKFFADASASSSPAPLSGEPLSGFPGADKVASLPSDMLRLTELQNKIMSMMIPK